jgi:hypothetical protein
MKGGAVHKRHPEARPSPTRKGAAKRGAVATANYEALAEFRYALRKFQAFSEDAAVRSGLTSQQNQALLSIKGAPEKD